MVDDDEPSLCARCAAAGATCCTLGQIFLTPGDIRRITAVFGDDTFYERIPIHSKAVLREASHDPAWGAALSATNGSAPFLRRSAEGCYFLGPTGCRLELGDRPLLCRLYPYNYTEAGICGVYAPFCPLPEQNNPALLLCLLEMHSGTAEKWRQQFYEEIAQPL